MEFTIASLTFSARNTIMETKKREIVSIMKDRIIYESILSLQSEGLKFSVDTLAEKLKISKKTIYKYFPNKESLALAIYKKYYFEANQNVKIILEESGSDLYLKLLHLYYESMKMIRSEIFNKYKLNEVILSYAEQQNNSLWNTISNVFPNAKTEKDRNALQIIINGAFEKLYITQTDPGAVIERLVILL